MLLRVKRVKPMQECHAPNGLSVSPTLPLLSFTSLSCPSSISRSLSGEPSMTETSSEAAPLRGSSTGAGVAPNGGESGTGGEFLGHVPSNESTTCQF